MQNKNTQKQAFYFTIINYVGVLIGIFSTLFIYPENKEMLGVFRYIESIAQLLFPILLLGASQSLINFYPKLDVNQKKKLFNYSVLSILLISGIVLVFLFLSSNFSFLKGMKYVYYAFPIAVFLALIELFKKQSTIIQKIAIPTFFDNILPKIALPVLFILLLRQIISTNQSLCFYVISYGMILILVTWYLFYHFKPRIDFNFKSLFVDVSKKEYYRFSIFALAGSLGSVFAFRIDAIMIKSFFSLESVGTFSIGVTLASAIAVPATGIFSLYAPIISNFLKNNQLAELNIKYKETAKLLFFIGAILYSCIFLGIENLFEMLPTHESLRVSIPIILILGFNVLINMGTGFNGEIITYSNFYKFNLIAILLLVILNITLNLVFILVFNLGIEAVAYASLISMVVFNFSKLWFIHRKFKLFPFDKSFLKLVIVLSSVLLICYFLPNLNNSFQNLIFKISVCLLLNLFIIYKLKLVYSYNFWVNKIIF
jgi:O-antigen/teichoic acid export membrane protein